MFADQRESVRAGAQAAQAETAEELHPAPPSCYRAPLCGQPQLRNQLVSAQGSTLQSRNVPIEFPQLRSATQERSIDKPHESAIIIPGKTSQRQECAQRANSCIASGILIGDRIDGNQTDIRVDSYRSGRSIDILLHSSPGNWMTKLCNRHDRGASIVGASCGAAP